MPLIDDVKRICDRLAPLGWRELLKTAAGGGLDIKKTSATALRKELTKNLPAIDREVPGFEDFASNGRQAVTPGQPSLSLLYHALASPLVTRDHLGVQLGGFVTPAELDTLENFIFSFAPVALPEFIRSNGGATKVAIVLFATEYRPAADSVDGRHADLTFSRTGIARVGTAPPRYLPESRGFWPEDESNPYNIRVLPAKFSAWLAVKKKGAAARVSPMLDDQEDPDANRNFWVPVHKLFSGAECVSGLTLALRFTSKLFNLKIQRVHRFLGTNPLPTGFPYVLTDDEIGGFSADPDLGPGWIVPKVRARLVDPAIVAGNPVTFPVAPENVDDFATLTCPDGSGAPEYVHARMRVTNGEFDDLNKHPNVIEAMKELNGYQALHYIDYSGEGWVSADLGVPGVTLPVVPAYVLASAPDFFPSSGQFELSEWSRSNQVPKLFRDSLWHRPPTPLSETRRPANLQLPDSPFKAADVTITAMVGMGEPTGVPAVWPIQPDPQRSSILPDDAAGVFFPGWDVGRDRAPGARRTIHLAGYTLGSPFPEDAKLCAALSAFWPAVAPDVFRTFINVVGLSNGTVAPLTDEEIGQSGNLPWDGFAGPREVVVNGQRRIEFASFLNADYVRQALQNRFTIRLTARIGAEQYQDRILAACRIYSVLSSPSKIREARDEWLMLSFQQVSSGNQALQEAQNDAGLVLQGRVYSARLWRLAGVPSQKIDPHTEQMPITEEVLFFASPISLSVLRKRATDAKFVAKPSEP